MEAGKKVISVTLAVSPDFINSTDYRLVSKINKINKATNSFEDAIRASKSAGPYKLSNEVR
jgi:hypothetical protein